MKEAMFYDTTDDGRLRCHLCPHGCLLGEGRRGVCHVRQNRDGKLMSLVYGRPVAQAVDPIEKKPLYHVLPGARVFSIGTQGCNLRCQHCQNCTISQTAPGEEDIAAAPEVEPEEIVRKTEAAGCAGIAYTYTEPTIFFEYAYDVASLARERGLLNVFVSNGYITPEAVRRIAPLLDAVNIDLKFFSDKLYRQVCGGTLDPVLDAIRLYYELGVWVEVTTLVIPQYNDDERQLGQIAGFIAAIDRDIPWHLTAFYPTYKLTHVAPTAPAALRKAAGVASQAGLRYVYLGNIGGHANTLCPDCGSVLIERGIAGAEGTGGLHGGRCRQCGAAVGGVWTLTVGIPDAERTSSGGGKTAQRDRKPPRDIAPGGPPGSAPCIRPG